MPPPPDCAAVVGALDLHVVALAERALVAIDRHEHRPARALVREATEVLSHGELDAYPTTTLLLAIRARTALRDGMPGRRSQISNGQPSCVPD